jgi:hypothetical protein
MAPQDPRRHLQQAIRRLRGNVTEVRHVAEALERNADYLTTGVPVPAEVWRALDLLEQWAQTIQSYPPRRPWRAHPNE